LNEIKCLASYEAYQPITPNELVPLKRLWVGSTYAYEASPLEVENLKTGHDYIFEEEIGFIYRFPFFNNIPLLCYYNKI